MALDIVCPDCGETEDIRGTRHGDEISLVCERCDFVWSRDPSPACARCGGTDLYPAIAAVVEKGRGTQLSVVGTRVVHLCEVCDAATLRGYFKNRPNPLMPDDLPNVFH